MGWITNCIIWFILNFLVRQLLLIDLLIYLRLKEHLSFTFNSTVELWLDQGSATFIIKAISEPFCLLFCWKTILELQTVLCKGLIWNKFNSELSDLFESFQYVSKIKIKSLPFQYKLNIELQLSSFKKSKHKIRNNKEKDQRLCVM